MLFSNKDHPSNDAFREKSKRPQLSCNSCRARKVKCDRLQPCTACSLHQTSDQCHYELSPEERKPIQQAEALRAKDREIAWLREQVKRLGGGVEADLPFEIRKKRKTSSVPRPDNESQISSEQASPELRAHIRTPPEPEAMHPDPMPSRPHRKAKPGVKSISIPSPGSTDSLDSRCSRSTHAWSDSDLTTANWQAEDSKRAFSSPDYSAHNRSKAYRSNVATTSQESASPYLRTGGPDCASMVMPPSHKMWNSTRYGAAVDSINAPTEAAFLPFAASSLLPPNTTAPCIASTYAYPNSLSAPSSASYPPSSYANSTNSSLHTPSASHPVSPTLSQHQPCCISQPQTQPPSPIWGFEAGLQNVVSHHPFVHSESANAAALMVDLATHEDKDNINQWQWKLAWTG